MKKRHKLCRHAGAGLHRHCGDCTRTCALGLGTNGTCQLTVEAQKCQSYEPKVKAQFLHLQKSLPVVQVDDRAGFQMSVVGDDHKLEPEIVGQGGKEFPDPVPESVPDGRELERLVENQ